MVRKRAGKRKHILLYYPGIKLSRELLSSNTSEAGATSALGIDKDSIRESMYDLMVGDVGIEDI
jgi:hypothetical protein